MRIVSIAPLAFLAVLACSPRSADKVDKAGPTADVAGQTKVYVHMDGLVAFQTPTSKSTEALFPLADEYTQNSFSTKMSQSGHGFIYKEFFGSDKYNPSHYATVLVPRIHLKNAIGSGYLLVRLNAKDPLDPFSDLQRDSVEFSIGDTQNGPDLKLQNFDKIPTIRDKKEVPAKVGAQALLAARAQF